MDITPNLCGKLLLLTLPTDKLYDANEIYKEIRREIVDGESN